MCDELDVVIFLYGRNADKFIGITVWKAALAKLWSSGWESNDNFYPCILGAC